MKRGLVSLAAGLFAVAMMAAPASAFLQNWSLDIDGSDETGGGAIAPTTINEYFDTIGPGYIVNKISNPEFGVGTFQDTSAFISQGHDGGLAYTWGGNYELTGLFKGNGSVNLNDGTIGFTGGTLNIYADSNPDFGSTAATFGANDGLLIGTFEVQGGAGSITPTGIPNGQISVEFQATSLLEGYWFDENGQDLSINPESFVFGVGTTNASYTQNPSSTVVGELAGGDPANTPPDHLFVGTNGQFRATASPVPVPGTIILLGSGLLGLAISSKRKFQRRMR